MNKLRLAAWAAVVVLAVAVEWLGRSGGLGLGAADLVVGLAFLACCLIVWNRETFRAVGLLFLATGFAWFLGTLAGSEVGTLSSLGSAMLYVHRGPFVQLILAYPTGHLRSRLDRVVVGGAYVDGLIVPFAQNDALTMTLVVAVAAAGVLGLRGRPVELRRARTLATTCFALVGVSLALVGISGLTQATAFSETTLLLAYEATLVATAISLTAWLLAQRPESAAVADLVVELGSNARSGTVRDSLVRVLGDPSLEIGYPTAGSFVDERGEPMTIPSASDERTVTFVQREGKPVAVLVLDSALTGDPAVAEAIALALRLTGSNARLQAELRAQVRELAASRRRVVEVGDAQRSRLERRLDQAVEVHLEEMRAAVARAANAASPELANDLARVERELDDAVLDLRELARGIHPHALTESGLAAALADLATAAPIRVSVAAPNERFPAAVEVAAYFVCAESLANAAKYAQTEAAVVGVRRENEQLIVRVADEGVGGADMRRGSGLRGLVDRVEAFGGRLSVSSPTAGGTSVTAEIPLDGVA